MFSSIVLSIVLGTSSAHAEEPVAASPPPAGYREVRNRLGLRNAPVAIVTWDPKGCPQFATSGYQYLTADTVVEVMEASTDARVRCEIAFARAEAIRMEAEAQAARDKADAGATLLLASAGADAVRTASGNGQAVYVNADNGVAATGNAAPLAAVDGNLGATGLNPWVIQGGQDLTALAVLNGGVLAPPVTPPTGSGNSGDSKKPKPPATTLSDAEARAAAALRDAGVE